MATIAIIEDERELSDLLRDALESAGHRVVAAFDGPEGVAAVEREDAWYVVVAGREADWLARFEKTAGFDARDWAMSMVLTFNARLRAHAGDPHPAGGG